MLVKGNMFSPYLFIKIILWFKTAYFICFNVFLQFEFMLFGPFTFFILYFCLMSLLLQKFTFVRTAKQSFIVPCHSDGLKHF